MTGTLSIARRVLAVNVGSSNVKLDVFIIGERAPERIARYQAPLDEPIRTALAAVLPDGAGPDLAAVVHRVVHGGRRLTEATAVDQAVEAELDAAALLAPLHNPRALAWLRVCRDVIPVPQIVVPDTGFFAGLPGRARRYALPASLSERLALRRYGFHGIAHSAMARYWTETHTAAPAAEARLITLQLGSGCSIAAIRGSDPIDTSMGFTPLEGLIMATRSGDVDPGLILHLIRNEGFRPEDLDRILNRESGLLGLGGSGDVRVLLASGSQEAEAAVEAFCYRARKYVGAYLAALDGADAVLFGGGIGENSPLIRAQVLEGMSWAGISLDPDVNRRAVGASGAIHSAGSRVAVHVVAVDEASEMIRIATPLLAGVTQ